MADVAAQKPVGHDRPVAVAQQQKNLHQNLFLGRKFSIFFFALFKEWLHHDRSAPFTSDMWLSTIRHWFSILRPTSLLLRRLWMLTLPLLSVNVRVEYAFVTTIVSFA